MFCSAFRREWPLAAELVEMGIRTRLSMSGRRATVCNASAPDTAGTGEYKASIMDKQEMVTDNT